MLTEFRLKMLNREAASTENKSSAIIENLNLQKGMVVGDIGSGGGYFTREFSKKVGDEGQIYAIDVNDKSLDFIGANLEEEGIQNVKTIQAHVSGIKLPEKVDLFFLRNVFHHLTHQEIYFQKIGEFLKDDGRIAIIDYNEKKFSFCGLFGHFTSENDLLDVMAKAGYYAQEKYDFLPNQSFVIFAKRND